MQLEADGLKTDSHDMLVKQLTQFMEECGWVHVRQEVQTWDSGRVRGAKKTNRVPDIVAVHPLTGRE